MRVLVNVFLKQEILDPQGEAIFNSLKRQGLIGLKSVRQGKQFDLIVSSDNSDAALNQIHSLAQSLLSNPVIEEYSIVISDES